MPISFTNFDTYTNTVIDAFVRENPVGQNIQARPLLKILNDNKKTFPGGADYVSIPVQGEFMSDQAGFGQWYSHTDQVGYVHPNNIRRVKYPWRESHVGAVLDFTELKKRGVQVVNGTPQTRPDAKEVQIVKDYVESVLVFDFGESYSRFMNYSVWADGSQAANAIIGLLGVLTDTNGAGTVGGLDRAVYGWWNHRVQLGITVSTATQNLLTVLRKEHVQLTRYGGMPRRALIGSDFLDAMRREQQSKGFVTMNNYQGKESTEIGMGDFTLDKTEFYYDPTLDSIGRSKYCYIIDPNHVKLQPMEDEDMVVQKPVRPYDQYVMFKALTWTGVLTFDQLNCHGVYSIN